MSLLINWLESLSIDTKITNRCTRHSSPKSSCLLCVSHCHSQSLSVEDNKVVVDVKKCNSCGDCTVVCPVGAVEGNLPKRNIINGMFAYSSEYCPSAKELLIYRKKGVKAIYLPANCLDERWNQAITEANVLLEQLGIEPYMINQDTNPEDRSLSRRELFLSVRKKGQSLAKELTPASWRMGADTWSLPANFPDTQFYQVALDTEKCTICQACFNLCPQKVFTVTDTELMIDHQKCSNCSLCSDICPEKAVTISEKTAERSSTLYSLVAGKCVRCKSSFYSFEASEQCHICANKPSDWLMP